MRYKMDLNRFEAKLIENKLTIGDIKKLLNYAFELQQSLEDLDVEIPEQNKENSNMDTEVKSTTLEALNLSVRSYNCLKRAGINTLGDITKLSLSELKMVRNLGKTSYLEVLGKLTEYGFALKMDASI